MNFKFFIFCSLVLVYQVQYGIAQETTDPATDPVSSVTEAVSLDGAVTTSANEEAATQPATTLPSTEDTTNTPESEATSSPETSAFQEATESTAEESTSVSSTAQEVTTESITTSSTEPEAVSSTIEPLTTTIKIETSSTEESATVASTTTTEASMAEEFTTEPETTVPTTTEPETTTTEPETTVTTTTESETTTTEPETTTTEPETTVTTTSEPETTTTEANTNPSDVVIATTSEEEETYPPSKPYTTLKASTTTAKPRIDNMLSLFHNDQELTSESSPIKIKQGSKLEVMAKSNQGFSEYHVYKNGVFVSRIKNSEIIFTVNSIQPHDHGVYTVYAFTSGSSLDIIYNTAKFSVEVETQRLDLKLNPDVHSIKLNIGASATIECFSADSDAKFMIFRNNKLLLTSGKLAINNAVEDDFGNYTCYGSISSQTFYAFKTFTVDLATKEDQDKYSPKLNVPSGKLELYTGNSFTLHCSKPSGLTQDYSSLTWSLNAMNKSNVHIDHDKLVILNASQDLAGEIGCQAKLLTGDMAYVGNSLPLNLIVRRKIVAQIKPNMINAEENDTVSLKCESSDDQALGSDTVSYKWSKNSQQLNETSNTYSFVIQSKADSGNYTCQIVDEKAFVESNTARSYIKVGREDPPELTFENNNEYDDHILSCRAISFYNLTKLEIVRVDAPITSDHTYFDFKERNSVELHLTELSDNDGVYQCLAENQFGLSSSIIEIDKYKVIDVNSKQTDIFVLVGDKAIELDTAQNIDVYCSDHRVKNTKWRRINGPSIYQTALPFNFKASSNLLQVSEFSQANEGQYACDFQDANETANTFVLTLKKKIQPVKPSVRLSARNLVLGVGSEFYIKCNVQGNSTNLKIEWLLNGVSLRSSFLTETELIQTKNVLGIRNTNQDLDGKNLTCSLVDQDENQVVSSDSVIITVKPDQTLPEHSVLSIKPEEVVVEQGENVTFLCSTSDKRLELVWTRDGVSVFNQTYTPNGVLFIKSAVKGDSGAYRCSAINNIQSSYIIKSAEATLVVKDPIPKSLEVSVRVTDAFTDGQNVVEIGAGEILKLVCEEKSNYKLPSSKLEYIWFKNNEPVNKVYANGPQLALRLDSSVNDSGNYSCRVVDFENEVKSNESNAITVVVRPVLKIVSNKYISSISKEIIVLETENLELNCYLTGKEIGELESSSLKWARINHTGSSEENTGISNGTFTRLVLNNITTSDAGKYTCIWGILELGTVSLQEFVSIRVEKKKIDPVKDNYKKEDNQRVVVSDQEKRSLYFEEHSNFTIVCNPPLANSINYTFEWFRVNTSSSVSKSSSSSDSFVNVPSNFEPRGNELHVTDFKHSDWSMYVCVANDEKKSKKYISMMIHQGKPPTANIKLRPRESFKQGDMKSLTCYNDGLPKPDIEWYFNGENVKSLPDRFVKMRNTLLIRATNQTNILGVYSCVAIGLHKKVYVSYVEIKLDADSNLYLIEPYSNQTLTTSTSATTSTRSSAHESVSTDTTTSRSTYSSKGDHETSTTSGATVSSTRSSSTSSFTGSTTTRKLEVYYGVGRSEIRLSRGANVDILCSSGPRATTALNEVNWFKLGKYDATKGEKLSFRNFDSGDQGVYYCEELLNGRYETRANLTLTLADSSKDRPKISLLISPTSPRVGDEVTILCRLKNANNTEEIDMLINDQKPDNYKHNGIYKLKYSDQSSVRVECSASYQNETIKGTRVIRWRQEKYVYNF